MKYYAVYFEPRGTLATMVTSDMLFGAVCWALRELEITDVGTMLGAFRPPLFAFSGLFPCYNAGNTRLRFYPKPLTLTLAKASVDALARDAQGQLDKATLIKHVEFAKGFNKFSYLSESLLKQVLSGELTAIDIAHRLTLPPGAATRLMRIGGVVTEAGKDPMQMPRIGLSMTQHNQIDRLAGTTGDGLLFYDPEIAFGRDTALWCLTAVNDEETWRQYIRPALRFLADTGLGANRSSGKGQFDILVEPLSHLPEANANANGMLCLSHYLPAPGEINVGSQPLAYQLVNVWPKREKRFTYNRSLYKRRLRMLLPGAVIPLPLISSNGIYGQLVQVVPAEEEGWSIYQSGLMLGLRGKL